MKRCISILVILVMTMTLLVGCAVAKTEGSDKAMQENIVLTETGEVLIKEQPTVEPEEKEEVNDLPLSDNKSST